MKLALFGDSHGDLNYIAKAHAWAEDNECAFVVQLGDWGFTFNSHVPFSEDPRYEALKEVVGQSPVPQVFLLGNHDNYEWARARNVYEGDSPVELAENLITLPRGSVWEPLEGHTFLAVSGAISVDQKSRVPFIDYWREEEITDEQVAAASKREARYMLCHDAPNSPTLGEFLRQWDSMFTLPETVHAKSANSRNQISKIVEKVRPEILFHGHYHWPYTSTYMGTYVVGTGFNGQRERCGAYLELETGDMGWINL